MVIEHAHRIIFWQENMPRDEMPPMWAWHLDWVVEEWLNGLDEKRRNPAAKDDCDQVPMADNELAAEYRKGRR